MDVVVDLSSYKATNTCTNAMHNGNMYFGCLIDSSKENKDSNTKTMEPVHCSHFKKAFFNPNVRDSIPD